ncbi:MMPL family transporter [Allonocardiopsis opalescens]|uniref:RND superfamily putative drug exporter n=1 Tax=Allonocardiopsis opalescens TaxID=1144618 RepID=A0A2T0PX40_9ACTN|nr:MMPL family transporter [Allonocardiopsis opalescens]PRX96104.1 RND superfamily putative drug exporter [Allonocardiopsis opalescens]
MAALLYRLGRFSYRRRWIVLGAWMATLVVLGLAALAFRGPTEDSFTIPGTESQRTLDMLDQRFPERSGGSARAVFQVPAGADVTDERYQEAIAASVAEMEDVDGVESAMDPFGLVETARQTYDEEIDAAIADAQAQARETARDMVREAAREQASAQIPEGTPDREQLLEFAESQALQQAGADAERQAEEEAERQVLERAPAFDEDEVLDQIPLLSDDRTVALVQVQFSDPEGSVPPEVVHALLETGDAARDAGMVVEFSGQSIISADATAIHGGEALGLAVALVVLIVNFGVLIAAGLPILVALVGVGVGMALLFAASSLIELSSTAPILAVMLGLAVGIDYALFVLSRHRQQLLDGMDPEESTARSIATAGSAVVFAGVTVMIALLGLTLVGIPFLGIMGVAASVTVLVSVLVAITLLPALLGFAGTRIGALRVPVLARRAEAAVRSADTLGARWVRAVIRFPLVTVLAVLVVLGAAIIPVMDMRLGLPNEESSPAESTQHRAYDIVTEGFGAGFNAPLLVVADLTRSHEPQEAAEETIERLDALDGVADVQGPEYNTPENAAMITVIPEHGPSDLATEDLLHDIRAMADELRADTDVAISVAGSTAIAIDVSERLGEALPVFLGVVVGLALILMMIVFRSIVVPIKAAVGFVLSAGAALGLTVLVFQWGVGAELLGVTSTPTLLAFMPSLLIGTLFGLAMDYEVFLVSRMREEFVHGADARGAIVTGFRQGSRVVTVAAVIMISVFAAFVFGDNTTIQPIAFALAVGVFLDAFLVRMVLVPAVMAVFGRSTWWLPRWLDRLLPNVDIEGENLRPETAPRHATREPEPAARS